jgi:predicted ferric reductase
MFLSPIFLLMVKRRMYEFFLRAHQGCAIFALYAIWKHVTSSQSKRWVLLLAILSAVTGALQFIRIIYRNIPRVKFLTENYGADALRLTLSLPRPWRIRAGQRVYVSIPRAGLLYMFHPHPFTIAWWEGDGNGGMSSITLIVRARSGFTKKLLDRIESGCEGWAWIDGPYGPSRDSIFGYSPEVGDYGHILMVATGIGIVAQLPYIKELVDGQRQGQVRTRRISLVWRLEQEGDYELARDSLQSLVKHDGSYVRGSYGPICLTLPSSLLTHFSFDDVTFPLAPHHFCPSKS